MLPPIPDQFKKVCLNFGPDIEHFVSSWDDMVLLALNGIDQADAAAIKPFLDDLLSGPYTPEQFKELWWSTPATTVFHDGRDVIQLLTGMREAISRPPYTNTR